MDVKGRRKNYGTILPACVFGVYSDSVSYFFSLEGCDLKDSILDISTFVDDLKAVGYRGFVSIEDFCAMDHREKLGRQIKFLQSVTL